MSPPESAASQTAHAPEPPAEHSLAQGGAPPLGELAGSASGQLLLSTVQIHTFDGAQLLTNASGFFFARGSQLFLATSRHVLIDALSNHFPDRIELQLHEDSHNLARVTGFSVLLYRDGRANWRQATDGGGEVDVAVIEIDRSALPADVLLHAFSAAHLHTGSDIEIGQALLIVGFPLGFHDNLHHLPVVRQGVLASAYGLRFQGRGFFLSDARTHRGMSGAPVVMRRASVGAPSQAPAWVLLGVHSSRLDMLTRDALQDETLGLNCSWYADVLLTLTETAAR